MKVLGIETSCDETGVAVYDTAKGALLGHCLHSQIDLHAAYGGVVPELASRDHIRRLPLLLQQLLGELGLRTSDIDAVAYTAGPGLAGALLVGASVAESFALAAGVPALPIHHLEGHLLSPLLAADPPSFPFVALLVSGGHTQLMRVGGIGDYELLGESLDDAAGEAFDKTAKLLGLGYPGGPAIERLARQGDAKRFELPRPLWRKPGCDFSFSGLKTAVRLALESCGANPSEQDKADLAASFQATVMAVILDRARHAIAMFDESHGAREKHFVVAGGVAANATLREGLVALAEEYGMSFTAPPLKLCTDNGAMIAWAGLERFRLGMVDTLEAPARARWPLDARAAAKPFAGVKA